MTNLQFTLELTDIINDLLETGITSCNIHQAREYFDDLCDRFEQQEDIDTPRVPITIDNFFDELNDIWQ